uniref:Myb/SANT-like DNA-binding domain-containing protein n=1 Tax=Nelumbo nucifera TaxID=4432 RepID=A0A822ZLP7_NELNU|nr:TPA_asm: hypothetical protein HUJ06_004352 [Nelumbo nucifera]
MEKGFYVSPQQCEDKFNDLNKRYKRVCAYQNSCGGGVGGAHHALEAVLESANHQRQQHCFHSPMATADATARNPKSISKSESEGLKLGNREEEEEHDGEDDDNEK